MAIVVRRKVVQVLTGLLLLRDTCGQSSGAKHRIDGLLLRALFGSCTCLTSAHLKLLLLLLGFGGTLVLALDFFELRALILKPNLHYSNAESSFLRERLSNLATRLLAQVERRLEGSPLARRQNRSRTLWSATAVHSAAFCRVAATSGVCLRRIACRLGSLVGVGQSCGV